MANQDIGGRYCDGGGDRARFDFDVDNYLLALDLNFDIADLLDKSWVIKPFVGASIGAAYHDSSSFRVGPGDYVNSKSNWDFAWGLTAGLRYFVRENVALDITYRYEDFGNAEAGRRTYDAAGDYGGDLVRAPEAKIHNHSVGIGLAYYF